MREYGHIYTSLCHSQEHQCDTHTHPPALCMHQGSEMRPCSHFRAPAYAQHCPQPLWGWPASCSRPRVTLRQLQLISGFEASGTKPRNGSDRPSEANPTGKEATSAVYMLDARRDSLCPGWHLALGSIVRLFCSASAKADSCLAISPVCGGWGCAA